MRRLRDEVDGLFFSVSATTRAPRPGEVDGVDYHFVTAEEFQRLIDTDALLEWADIHGGLQRSGTRPRPCVRPWKRAARRSSRSIWPVPGRSKPRSRRLSLSFWRHRAGRRWWIGSPAGAPNRSP
ncbi:guanylate kinase [Mycobacteroides abscessus subsp. bolletii 1513]|uniref:Guanylate kinase n=1 Tax=Mycobacteroides abscessus subsp. bolletii 1513 TaxID=1299321 RepID=X8DSW4_9MYCO|nr:guanylate kinase [Mycobacteroides abscessus subsp. bolletii 1513]